MAKKTKQDVDDIPDAEIDAEPVETELPPEYQAIITKGDRFIPFDPTTDDGENLENYLVSVGAAPEDDGTPFLVGVTQWWDLQTNKTCVYAGRKSDGSHEWRESLTVRRFVVDLEKGSLLGELKNKSRERKAEIETKTAERLAELIPTDSPTLDSLLEELD
jgi:hypothetical protein